MEKGSTSGLSPGDGRLQRGGHLRAGGLKGEQELAKWGRSLEKENRRERKGGLVLEVKRGWPVWEREECVSVAGLWAEMKMNAVSAGLQCLRSICIH